MCSHIIAQVLVVLRTCLARPHTVSQQQQQHTSCGTQHPTCSSSSRALDRFRERQKQRVAELEEKVAELEARLANVKVEKASLQNRNGILEKVVAMGDHKVQRMRSIVKVLVMACVILVFSG